MPQQALHDCAGLTTGPGETFLGTHCSGKYKGPGFERVAWISTLYCISSHYVVITMPVKAAHSFSFQCILITEWQVKKPHTVVGILIPVCLSHGKQFRWAQHCAAIIQHLLYGMEKMHCHQAAVKEPLKGSQGFSSKCWGFDRDTGLWVVVQHPSILPSTGTEVERTTTKAEPEHKIKVHKSQVTEGWLYSLAKSEKRGL